MRRLVTFRGILLLSLLAAALIPLFILGVSVLVLEERNILKQVSTSNLALARGVARQVELSLDQHLRMVEHLGKLAANVAGKSREADRLLREEMEALGVFESFFLLDQERRVEKAVFSGGLPASASDYEGADFSTLPILSRLKPGSGAIDPEVFISPVTGEPSIRFAAEAGRGFLIATMGLGVISDITAGIRHDDGTVMVLSGSGKIIGHPDHSLVRRRTDLGGMEMVRMGLAGSSDTYHYRAGGREMLASLVKMPRTGWLVMVDVPAERALAPIERFKIIFLVSIAGALVLALCVSLLGRGLVLGPISNLMAGVRELKAGRYDFVFQGGHFREIEELAQGVRAMADAVREREQELMERNEELAMIEEELRQQIDEYQRLHDSLSESEERYRLLVESSPDAIVIHSGGRYVFANPAALRLFGVKDVESIIGRRIIDFVHPDDRERIAGRVETLYRDMRPLPPAELRLLRPDGTVVEVDVVGIPFIYEGQKAVQSVLRDITVRKEAERKILLYNEELEQRVRERTALLEAANRELESFSYSVSHDLRAPLRHIDGFSALLMEDYAGKVPDDAVIYLEKIRVASRRMGQLIDDLLELSRVSRAPMGREPVDLGRMVMELTEEYREASPHRQVIADIAEGVIVEGDPLLLRVAMANLVDNAWKYTGKKDVATISFGETVIEGERVIFMRDDGVGFDMKYSGKLFGPFQRLHSVDEFEGTGIGLATVQRIVQRHGGRIWASAEEGKGATFYMVFP